MLDFLLELKSMCFILASAHKSLFFFSLKPFMNVFRSCPFPRNPSSFLLGPIFFCIAFLLPCQSFLKLGAALQGWVEQEDLPEDLQVTFLLVHTSVIFVFSKTMWHCWFLFSLRFPNRFLYLYSSLSCIWTNCCSHLCQYI